MMGESQDFYHAKRGAFLGLPHDSRLADNELDRQLERAAGAAIHVPADDLDAGL